MDEENIEHIAVISHKKWWVYIVECKDTTLYTGCTNDLERRIRQHNTSTQGAHYTLLRRPVVLRYSEECENRSSAQKREYVIKCMTRSEKVALLRSLT